MSDGVDINTVGGRWKSLEDTETSDGYGRYFAFKDHSNKVSYASGAPTCFYLSIRLLSEQFFLHTGKFTSSLLVLFSDPQISLICDENEEPIIFGANVTFMVFSKHGFDHSQLSLRIRTPVPQPTTDELNYDIVRIAKEFAANITVEGEECSDIPIDNHSAPKTNTAPAQEKETAKTTVADKSVEELTAQFNLHPVELTKFNCRIEDGVFANYFGDESEIILPDGIHAIKEVSLSDSSFSAVVVPEGVTSIGFSAFSDCANLETVILPHSLETIEDNAFSCCTALKNINIPYGIETINEGTFYECQSLETIDLPGSIKYIKKWAFSESGLIKIAIPEGVEEIWEMMFYRCAKLESVCLPSTLKKIGNSAFYSCDSLSDLYVPSSVCEIDEYGLGYPDGDITIHTPAGSFTDGYCRKNGYRVVNDI